MKTSMSNYKYLLKVTYPDGLVRTCPFTTKRDAELYAKAFSTSFPDCKVEIKK